MSPFREWTLSQVPPQSWESRGLIGMPFTIGAVTQWIVQRYRDQVGLSAAAGRTFFRSCNRCCMSILTSGCASSRL